MHQEIKKKEKQKRRRKKNGKLKSKESECGTSWLESPCEQTANKVSSGESAKLETLTCLIRAAISWSRGANTIRLDSTDCGATKWAVASSAIGCRLLAKIYGPSLLQCYSLSQSLSLSLCLKLVWEAVEMSLDALRLVSTRSNGFPHCSFLSTHSTPPKRGFDKLCHPVYTAGASHNVLTTTTTTMWTVGSIHQLSSGKQKHLSIHLGIRYMLSCTDPLFEKRRPHQLVVIRARDVVNVEQTWTTKRRHFSFLLIRFRSVRELLLFCVDLWRVVVHCRNGGKQEGKISAIESTTSPVGDLLVRWNFHLMRRVSLTVAHI